MFQPFARNIENVGNAVLPVRIHGDDAGALRITGIDAVKSEFERRAFPHVQGMGENDAPFLLFEFVKYMYGGFRCTAVVDDCDGGESVVCEFADESGETFIRVVRRDQNSCLR